MEQQQYCSIKKKNRHATHTIICSDSDCYNQNNEIKNLPRRNSFSKHSIKMLEIVFKRTAGLQLDFKKNSVIVKLSRST